MKQKIYVETTIASYLTARPSRDLITAAHQQTTREWWDARRNEFELYISQPVIQESGAGDHTAAKRRLAVLSDIALLDITSEVASLANALVTDGPLPEIASVDALHIAVAAVNGMNYLLTWNISHIANATLRSQIEAICRTQGYEPPVICTPEELLEG